MFLTSLSRIPCLFVIDQVKSGATAREPTTVCSGQDSNIERLYFVIIRDDNPSRDRVIFDGAHSQRQSERQNIAILERSLMCELPFVGEELVANL